MQCLMLLSCVFALMQVSLLLFFSLLSNVRLKQAGRALHEEKERLSALLVGSMMLCMALQVLLTFGTDSTRNNSTAISFHVARQ